MWESYQDIVVSFFSSSISRWTLDLNTWDNTEDEEYKPQSTKRIVDSDRYIDAMDFDAPNPGAIGKDNGLELYEKVWGDLASQLSTAVPQTFRVGAFLYSFSLR